MFGFGMNVVDYGSTIALQSDDKIVVTGYTHNGNDYDAVVARFTSNGVLDTSFSGDGSITIDLGSGDSVPYSILIASDGKILTTGYVGPPGGQDSFIFRLTTSGALDNSFNGNGKVVANLGGGNDDGRKLVIHNSKLYLLVGTGNSQAEIRVARYGLDGIIDNSFSSNGIAIHDISTDPTNPVDMIILPDGSILLAGYMRHSDRSPFIAKLKSSGALDTNFKSVGYTIFPFSGDSGFEGLLVQPDGKIVCFGFSNSKGIVVRLDSNGNFDSSFDGDGYKFINNGRNIYSVKLLDNGKLVGISVGTGVSYVFRLNIDGSFDNSFGVNGVFTMETGPGSDIRRIVNQQDGKIIAFGSVNNLSSNSFDIGMFRISCQTAAPTKNPTKVPTKSPSDAPSNNPTKVITESPSTTNNPTTEIPTTSPTSKTQESNNDSSATAIALGIVIPIIFLAAACVFFFRYRPSKGGSTSADYSPGSFTSASQPPTGATNEKVNAENATSKDEIKMAEVINEESPTKKDYSLVSS